MYHKSHIYVRYDNESHPTAFIFEVTLKELNATFQHLFHHSHLPTVFIIKLIQTADSAHQLNNKYVKYHSGCTQLSRVTILTYVMVHLIRF